MATSLIFSNDVNRKMLSLKHNAGKLQKIHAGVYSDDLTTPPEALARAHMGDILKDLAWTGRLAWRSALPGHEGEGTVRLVGDRPRTLDVAGVTLQMDKPNQLTHACQVMAWRGGIQRPTLFAALLENVSTRSREIDKVDPQAAQALLGQWLERKAATDGVGTAQQEARRLMREAAEVSGRSDEAERLDHCIAEWGQAHATMARYDYDLIERCITAAGVLQGMDLPALTVTPPNETYVATRRFFEAYFTNYIEGTRLAVDEAYALMGPDGLGRNDARLGWSMVQHKDEHDMAGMLEILKDTALQQRLAGRGDAEDWLAAITEAHGRMFVHRKQEVDAGNFKQRANRAGTTRFTDPALVEGTLVKLHRILEALPDGFARATLAHNGFVSTHPFNDGNGRTTRLILNAALEAQGPAARIIVPQYWRGNYINALEAWSWHGDIAPTAQFFQRMGGLSLGFDWAQGLQAAGTSLDTLGAWKDQSQGRWGEFQETAAATLLPTKRPKP